MKIAVLIDAWFPITGGGQVHVAKISQILTKKFDCQIEIITNRVDGKLKWKQSLSASQRKNEKFKVIRLGPSWSFENFLGRIIFLFLATLKLLFSDCDLISAHAFLPAIPAKTVSLIKKTPLILTVHGVSVNVWEEMTNKIAAKFFQAIEKIILFGIKYDYQISVSSDFLKYKNVNKNITVIGNGVDIKEFEKVQVKKAKLFKILFVGRIHAQKGLFYLVDAIKIISKKHPEVYIVIIGEGPQEVQLKKYIKNQGLLKHFVFKGKLVERELIAEYKSSHLFVLPSVYEGFPLTLLEAWAAKLPIVATSVGEVPKLIKNGVNGVLVKPVNSKDLAESLISVIENKNREKMGEAGEKIAQKFSWDEIAEKTYKIFKKVVKNA